MTNLFILAYIVIAATLSAILYEVLISEEKSRGARYGHDVWVLAGVACVFWPFTLGVAAVGLLDQFFQWFRELPLTYRDCLKARGIDPDEVFC